MVPMIVAIGIVLAHTLGVLSSISALLTTRTAQGAIAWIFALNTVPYVAVPAYWIFGRSRFNGYVRTRQTVDARLRDALAHIGSGVSRMPGLSGEEAGRIAAVERLARLPFTPGNRLSLLSDGEAAFEAMFRAIRDATEYVFVQFYIIRDDHLGRDFADLLAATVARGVSVRVLFDEIGSYALPRSYVRNLRRRGVAIRPFASTRGPRNRFQLNFRNHRKVLVVDGREGFLGGFNVGDEYLGRSQRFGPWRDTHVHITGPALIGLQLSFAEDWHWATGEVCPANWTRCTEPAESHGETHAALVIPSGPADDQPTAGLMVQHAIHSARERLWIASPYFVPDEGVQDALKLAVLRGVDVRILIPDRPDHLLVYYSAFAFLGPMLAAGVRVFRYRPGFLHQKVFVVDEDAAGVGTVNLDNRSFRLNFEITCVALGRRWAEDVAEMLERDFERSREMSAEEMRTMGIARRLLARTAYLLAPIQ